MYIPSTESSEYSNQITINEQKSKNAQKSNAGIFSIRNIPAISMYLIHI